MSWQSWGGKNLSSFVSQGLEQVNKLKDDVEKQFDDAVHNSEQKQKKLQDQPPTEFISDPPIHQQLKQPTIQDDFFDNWEMGEPKQKESPPTADELTTKKPLQQISQPTEQDDFFDNWHSGEQKQDENETKCIPQDVDEQTNILGIEQTTEKISLDHSSSTESTGQDPLVDGFVAVEPTDTKEDYQQVDEKIAIPNTNVESTDLLKEQLQETPIGETEQEVLDESTSRSSDDDTCPMATNENENSEVQEDDSRSENGTDTLPPILIHQDTEKDANNSDIVMALEEKITELKKIVETRESQLSIASTSISQLHNELEEAQQRQQMAEIELANKTSASNAKDSSETEILHLKDALQEKEEQMQGLLSEGNALSKKQAQIEQRVRQLRKEKDEAVAERDEFKQKYEESNARELQKTAILAQLEKESKEYNKNAKALQDVKESTSKKNEDLIEELDIAQEKIEQLAAQLAQSEEKCQSLKIACAELKSCGENSEILRNEVLRSQETIEQLETSLKRNQDEANYREDNAKKELQHMQRRWQDAVSRMDEMGRSVSDATQPLIRQISALQSDQRNRTRTWQISESSLLAQISSLQTQNNSLEQEKHELTIQLQDEAKLKQTADRQKSMIKQDLERSKNLVIEYEQKEYELEEEIKQLKEKIEDLEVGVKRKQQQQHSNHQNQLTQLQEKMNQELQNLKVANQQLHEEKTCQEKETHRLQLKLASVNSSNHKSSYRNGAFNSTSTSSVRSESQSSILQETLHQTSTSASSTSQEAWLVELNHCQQSLRLKESENHGLKSQLVHLEDTKTQLSEEVIRLSTQNSLWEESVSQLEATQKELTQVNHRYHVLLELLGEKEEQLEEIQSEFADFKDLYHRQIDTLTKN